MLRKLEFNFAGKAEDVFSALVIQNRTRLEAANSSVELQAIADDIKHKLPPELREQIESYRRGECDLLSIRSTKVTYNDAVPITPEFKPSEQEIEKLLFRASLALVNGLVGTDPLRNSDGSMQINHVIPRAPKDTFEVSSTDVDLSFHVDGMRRLDIPSSIALYCVRSQPGANTYFVCISDVLKKLDPEVVRALQQNHFAFDDKFEDIMTNGSAFGTKHRSTISLPYSLLDNNGQLRYSQRSSGINQTAKDAIVEFRKVMEGEPRTSISLSDADISLFRNDQLLHGRSTFPFEPSLEKRRWVLRQTSIGSFNFQTHS